MRIGAAAARLALLAALLSCTVVGGAQEANETADAGSRVEAVDIHFATNRGRDSSSSLEVSFNGERGEPSLGICRVVFETIPWIDEIADNVPFFVPSETSEQLVEVEPEAKTFWSRLAAAVAATDLGDLIVFLHGYSYDFERSCDRAAGAQRAMAGEAVVLLLTWPSNGSATDYVSDLNDLDWSVPFLEVVLQQAIDRLGAEHVHVVAHSMGARGIIEVLERMDVGKGDGPVIGRLVLLAPDFDTDLFLGLLPDLESKVSAMTLYASDNDMPLKVSATLNGAPRLGQAGEELTVADGLETVDVTPAGRYQIFGHEYFYFHPRVGADIVELLTSGKSAADRQATRPRTRDGSTYWEIGVGETP